MKFKIVTLFIVYVQLLFAQNNHFDNSNDQMQLLLSKRQQQYCNSDNIFCPNAIVEYYDSIAKNSGDVYVVIDANAYKADNLINIGNEQMAIDLYEDINSKVDTAVADYYDLLHSLAIAYMRLGEKQNCVNNHSSESCIMPIMGAGIHVNKTGSLKAIELYEKILKKYPNDYEAMWMLNIAYMTLGKYPQSVPVQWLIPQLDKNDTLYFLKPFKDVAMNLGLAYRNCAGGAIVEDFNNDNYLDIITSDWYLTKPMHAFFSNKKNGFNNVSQNTQLNKFTGGLNMIHADYDNDGDNDILVLRGGWMEEFGEQPNSLLRNNGNNTFTDVTISSGLFCEYPTQTAVFRDFNNDGWLDIFIGNESYNKQYPCQLFISNKNGTFTDVAQLANCNVVGYVKGVNAADINNDGWQDIVISAFEGRLLLLNKGTNDDNIPIFENVTKQCGIGDLNGKTITFSVWFWDYDNDGWQDVFVAGYGYKKSFASYCAMDALGIENDGSKLYLYHNNKNGTFTNVSQEARLNKSVFPMGANFGDIDNDGYLDMYLGTGNPDFSSLIPNKLYRNMGNGTFADVTVSAKVGNLQKGHGVVIIDMDNDGDSDIFEEIGGAFPGDAFLNSLYLNPGQNNNSYIKILLQGKQSNASAIGSRIKLTFKDNQNTRFVYVDVNTGGSFGSASLRRDIGLGHAKIIDEIEITWAGSSNKQYFYNVKPNQYIKITENDNSFKVVKLKKLKF